MAPRVFILISALILNSCHSPPEAWETIFTNIGTSSSPRMADLNQDGIQDIVIGAGGKEWESSAYGVVAINGKDGKLLWNAEARNQIVGSAIFQDITGDSIPEVFIGGRSAQFMCLNGRDGEIIWEYLPSVNDHDYYNDTTTLNFYTPQWVPDQDNDGYPEMINTLGGFVKAKPGETNRPAGYVMVFSSKTGKVLAKMRMPDHKETYFSPVYFKDGVIFGTGGETIRGNLYYISLSDLINNHPRAQLLASAKVKGFIAPPLLIDVSNDQVKDLIVFSVESTLTAINGADFTKLWEVALGENLEAYGMPAPGHFNDDNICDFFVSAGVGSWPDIKTARQFWVNGKNGEVIKRDSAGSFQYSSPVSFDSDGDGLDEVMFTINQIDKSTFPPSFGYPNQMLSNKVMVFSVTGDRQLFNGLDFEGTNLGSTPALTDLDNDQRTDLIYIYNTNPHDFFGFDGMNIQRRELSMPTSQIRWGCYINDDYRRLSLSLSR